MTVDLLIFGIVGVVFGTVIALELGYGGLEAVGVALLAVSTSGLVILAVVAAALITSETLKPKPDRKRPKP